MLKNKKIWFFSFAIFVFQAMLLFYLYEKNANSDVLEALARNNNRFDYSTKAIMQNTNDLSSIFQHKMKKSKHGKEAYLLSEDIRKEAHELYAAMDSILVFLEKEAKISSHLSDTTQQNINLFYADLQEKLDMYYEKMMPLSLIHI